MSYRELRNFSEIMRNLGYKRIISQNNFRTPNFELVADILYWLVHRYDSDVDISDDITTEEKRIIFLKSIAKFMMSQHNIKLSIKQLYKADGYAVKELLKISSLLYKANKYNNNINNNKINNENQINDDIISNDKINNMHNMSSDIIESGSKLYNLLEKEKECKILRDKSLLFINSMSHDLENNNTRDIIDKALRSQLNVINDKIDNIRTLINGLEEDESSLQSKIERKNNQIELSVKRLMSLKKVRPAFMEEYEEIEEQIRIIYNEYITKIRNLNYLENTLIKYREAEKSANKQHQRRLRRMQQRMKDEELRVLRGDSDTDSLMSERSNNKYVRPSEADPRRRSGRSIDAHRRSGRGSNELFNEVKNDEFSSILDDDDDDDDDLEDDDAEDSSNLDINDNSDDDDLTSSSEESDNYF